MASKYTKTKGSRLYISENPSEDLMLTTTEMVGMSCSVKDMSFSSPAGEEIDISTLCSETKETIDGMAGESTVTINANFVVGDQGQDLLRESKDTGKYYAFLLQMENGSKVAWIARCNSFDFATGSGVMSGSFSLKVKGNFKFEVGDNDE